MESGTAHSILKTIFRPEPTPQANPLPVTGRTGRYMPAAITIGLILAAVTITSLILGPVAVTIVLIVAMLLAMWECAGAFARINITIPLIPLYAGIILILITTYLFGMSVTSFVYAVCVVVVCLWAILGSVSANSAFSVVVVSVFLLTYLPLFSSFMLTLMKQPLGPWLVGAFVLTVCANDVGGWAAGVLFGRHPLVKKISPKKTWEGFAGSVLLCIVVATICVVSLRLSIWWGPFLGIATALTATVGDLVESIIKRKVDLKDMSAMLPGHGGLFDRCDSLLMCAPIAAGILILAAR